MSLITGKLGNYFGPGKENRISCNEAVLNISGGWKNRVDSRLTLMKEDTISHHLFVTIKNRVSAAAVMQYENLQTGNSRSPLLCSFSSSGYEKGREV